MNNLNWEVFVTPGIPIVTRERPVGIRETFFQATASTLIYGDKDAVLVDAYMTTKQANTLADWVASKGKNLTAIYITHGHGDHWFGVGIGLGSANRSIRQARTADKNSADPSIFSCYEGRLTSSFSRAVVGLCLVAALVFANRKFQPVMFLTVYGDQPERTGFGRFRKCSVVCDELSRSPRLGQDVCTLSQVRCERVPRTLELDPYSETKQYGVLRPSGDI